MQKTQLPCFYFSNKRLFNLFALAFFSTVICLLLFAIPIPALAQAAQAQIQNQDGIIQNPVLSREEGTYAGVQTNPLGSLIARLWKTSIIVGSLLLIIYLVWGAIDWISSSGEPDKLKSAKAKLMHAIIGLFILTASYAIVIFLRVLFNFDLLKLAWPSPTSQTNTSQTQQNNQKLP